MKYTNVKMKDGREFYGAIWEWRPKLGWFTLVLDEQYGFPREEEPRNQFDLSLVESAVEGRVMTHAGVIEDVDLIERAKKEGWEP